MSLGNWTVTPAQRYEASSINRAARAARSYDKDALMGGVSVRYAFGNGISVFGSAAHTEVLPPIDDLGNAARIDTTEKALTYESVARMRPKACLPSKNALAFKVNYYDTTLRDVTSQVVALPQVGTPVGPPQPSRWTTSAPKGSRLRRPMRRSAGFTWI